MDIKQFKLCLFDVDKTLTNSQRQISTRTKNAIQKLSQEMHVGVCTGRHFATLSSFALSFFPSQSLHVVSSGAQVITTNGQGLWQVLIPANITRQIIELTEHSPCTLVIQDQDILFTNTNQVPVEEIDVKRKPIASLDNFAVPVIVMYDIKEIHIASLSHIPQIHFNVMIGYDGVRYAEITAAGVTKATGVKKLCDLLKIKSSEVVGFGDSTNDVEFLQSVGYAVAMGNAIDSVKQIADEVIASCDVDGVAEFIERNL